MIYGELGRFELASTIEKRMVNFWARVCQGKASKLSNIMYRLLRQLHDHTDYKSKWITKVENILVKCGMRNIWLSPQSVSRDWLKRSVERKLQDLDMQKWRSEVERNRLCTNYKLYKNVVGLERYILVLDPLLRNSLCKYRCGNHNLPISSGRYLTVPTPRICNLCDLQDQGDEFHYILVCPAFKQHRDTYIANYYSSRPNTMKLYQLFNTNSIRKITNLARFCKIIMSYFA